MASLKNIARSIIFSTAIFPVYNFFKYKKERSQLLEKLNSGQDLLSDLPPIQKDVFKQKVPLVKAGLFDVGVLFWGKYTLDPVFAARIKNL